MAVNDIPLAVLAEEVNVGDAQGVRLGRDAIHGHAGVFIADGVGQAPLASAATSPNDRRCSRSGRLWSRNGGIVKSCGSAALA